MHKSFSMELGGRTFTVETGKLAQLANASVLARYGDTVILIAATASDKPRDGIDFFPLSVDYDEKLYSVGKIPGSYMRREARPSENAILTSRVIDRQMRPLFPDDLRNDVSIVTTVMSVDQDNSPEISAAIGASLAVAISDIPFNGPIGCVSVGLIDGQFIINPNVEQKEKSTLELTLSASKNKIIMIEAGADQIPEDVMMEAIRFGHEEIKRICSFIDDIVKEIGKPKFEYESFGVDQEVYSDVEKYALEDIKKALDTPDKDLRDSGFRKVAEKVAEEFKEKYEDKQSDIAESLDRLQKAVVRRWILEEGKRVDGRSINEIRELSSEVSILPRTHGSGLFTRGQTQVLTIATLGTLGDIQFLDGIEEDENKRYMHHYNFPSYSVGETRPSRGPGRREIGHGALAEKALLPVIPSEEEFPYAIRLVSEVLSSNGSTSLGSVCGSTLALMDAGVPIKTPVAGISAGLVTEGEKFVMLNDIQGIEDFFGDMDFKVAGTKKGITAIQVDIKNDGLTYEIVEQALKQTGESRIYILDEVMLKAINTPRNDLSAYAPKIITMNINPDKIRDVIGPGGKIIQKIIADTGVKIDIEDDGKVFISTTDAEAANKAVKIIEGIVADVEVGKIYLGKVVKLMDFGAFVEVLPGKQGLVHISKLAHKRVEKVEDVVSEGEEIMVKVTEIDRQGRINLSRKDALPVPNKNE